LIGWTVRSWIDSEPTINALLMAVLRRKPEIPLIVHSDQGSQYSSHDWQDFLKAHYLIASMSWRGNCHDNAIDVPPSIVPRVF
jgi:putative transposase